ncbi:MAG: phosphonopyruvate decarboxylase [Thermoprotei archaeon]|nr:MAG: phosphonopyruvate decarboxylase [Thermoprotei archaeon]
MKLLYVVLDGAADRLVDKPTSYEVAKKPSLDSLARKSKGGMVFTIARGIAPESDSAVLSILGYDPHKQYTGRGPIEALGAGIRIREEYEVAFRANFATVDDSGKKIIDRRCGRSLTSEEAKELAKSVRYIDLGKYDAYAKVVATVGHRAVVVIGSDKYKLSGNVSNTDPAYRKEGPISIAVKSYEPIVAPCTPLNDSLEAKRTAELANIFTQKVFEALKDHRVNLKRKKKGLLPANIILLRDAGNRLPRIPPISELYSGKKFSAIAEMPVEKGIARLTQMSVAEVELLPDKRREYSVILDKALTLLKESDVVYVHLKGPDEPGHDGKLEKKVKSIELIDEYFIKPLLKRVDLNKTAILVTSDHATPYSVKAHTDDPVPFLVYSPDILPDGLSKFSEKECFCKGSLGLLDHGWMLLKKVFQVIEK